MSQASATPAVTRLLPPVDAEALAVLKAGVTNALREGGRCIVDLDAIPILDSKVISTLIATLREVRETGGEIALGIARKDLLETLSVTGLDRVFSIVPPPEPETSSSSDPPAPKTRTRRRASRLATATALAAALLAGPARSTAAIDPANGVHHLHGGTAVSTSR